uniref:Uncharacterized protein n=1 Tax=Ananas comosus var. bracteatus TaxID=296719 RepID=A0A6V7QW86_ANACO
MLSFTCSLSIASKKINEGSKLVWVWTESRQVMTAAVERGWRTFVFGSEPFSKELVQDWSCVAVCAATALIHPLSVDGSKLLDEQGLNVGMFLVFHLHKELELIRPDDMEVDNLVINFQGEWQVIPAENKLQHSRALRGLYWLLQQLQQKHKCFSRYIRENFLIRFMSGSYSNLSILIGGMKSVVVSCDLAKAFWFALSLSIHGLCTPTLQSDGGRSKWFVANSYCGRVKIESRPLVLVEAKENLGEETYSIFLQNAETLCAPICLAILFVSRRQQHKHGYSCDVLKVGDKILVRKQGGARHTGIEIREFILEK